MFGKLYIVATPIGNLEDMTFRAVSTLSGVDAVLAEDTRVTGKLLKHFDIENRLLSYHHHSKDERKLEILKLLIEGKNLALVTDAGTPGISDPGNELVDFLLDKEPKIEIVPIPGASSLTAALSICGFDVSKFKFLGFLPKKGRSKLLSRLAKAKVAQVFFESPNRLEKTLSELTEHLGEERRVFVGRELTKMHEEVFRGKLGEVKENLSQANLKGEVVVVVEKNYSN